MIIEINIGDNDYAERISRILDNKVNGLKTIVDEYYSWLLDEVDKNTDRDSIKKYCDIAKERDSVMEFLKFENKDNLFSNIDIHKRIKESVLFLIKNSFSQDNLEYLEKQIVITFPTTIDGKWKNGEVIYYFPTTYSYNQFLLF